MSGLVALGQCPDELQNQLRSVKALFDEVLEIIHPIQYNSSCFVNLCRDKASGRACVVKSYPKSRLDACGLNQVVREFQLHHQLRSEHVVPFWAAVDDGGQIHIILEWCNQGDLRGLMCQGPLPEAIVRDKVLVPLLHALADMHCKGLVHRDIKPENVFLAGSKALLGDFSLAVGPLPTHAVAADVSTSSSSSSLLAFHRQSQMHRCSNNSSSGSLDSMHSCDMDSSASSGGVVRSSSISSLQGSLIRSLSLDSQKQECIQEVPTGAESGGGTPAYCAPEVVLASFNNTPMADALGPQADVWALGVMAVECLSGCHPFGDAAMPAGRVMCNVISGRPLQLNHLPVSAECKDWLAAALAKDPKQRWSVAQLLQHAWMKTTLPESAAATPDGMLAWEAVCLQQQKQKQCMLPGDEWAARLSSKAAGGFDSMRDRADYGCIKELPWMAHCRQQQQHQQQQQPAAMILRNGSLSGIMSWED